MAEKGQENLYKWQAMMMMMYFYLKKNSINNLILNFRMNYSMSETGLVYLTNLSQLN